MNLAEWQQKKNFWMEQKLWSITLKMAAKSRNSDWLLSEPVKTGDRELYEKGAVGSFPDSPLFMYIKLWKYIPKQLKKPAKRRCPCHTKLICDCQAQECARTRKHSIEEMQKRIEEMLSTIDWKNRKIPGKGMLYEWSAHKACLFRFSDWLMNGHSASNSRDISPLHSLDTYGMR